MQCQPADGGNREGMWRGSGASGAAHERRRVPGTERTRVFLLGWNRHEPDLSVQQGCH